MKTSTLTLTPASRFMSDASALPIRSQLLHKEARARRATAIAAAVVAMVHGLQRWARLVKERHQQWREARATYESLSNLDDRALRDLGFDRLEISSVAAEVSGQTERTRSHVIAAS